MTDKREEILHAARRVAQSQGYRGLNFRDLASTVGVKSSSVHYYFPFKADLGAALARQYRERSENLLSSMWEELGDPQECLRQYPRLFRKALLDENRMCMCSQMVAEHDDLPEEVKKETLLFSEVHVAWLRKWLMLSRSSSTSTVAESHAKAIYASVVGAQLMARGQAEIAVFDSLIETYQEIGLLPR